MGAERGALAQHAGNAQLLCVPLMLAGAWLLWRKAPVLARQMPQTEQKNSPRSKQPKGRKK